MAIFAPDVFFMAEKGAEDVQTRLAELQAGAEVSVDNLIRYLRSLPAEDMAKKRELARFFQSIEGNRYTRGERKAAYDELLGVERNRRTIG